MSVEPELPDRFVKLDEVKRRVGLGKSMIYRLIQEGRFPAPYKLSPFASRWSDRELVAWIDRCEKSVLKARAGKSDAPAFSFTQIDVSAAIAPDPDGVDAPRRHLCAKVEVLKHH